MINLKLIMIFEHGQEKFKLKGPTKNYSLYFCNTVVCKIVHKFASVWCKTAQGEVGVSLP